MKRILVIDDEEWLREMVHMALRQRGFDVLEAENGLAGVEVARKTLPDLILCDVNMEHMDGYATLSALRSEAATATIPLILMTGLADNAGMRHGMELGADDYLPKPFSLDALYAAVDVRLKKVEVVRVEAEKKLANLRDSLSLMLPHELRTPLNGILAFGEILATDAASLPATEIAEMGQTIHESGKRLQRLVENFLIYAQIELLGADPKRLASFDKEQTIHPREVIQTHAAEQARAAGRESDLTLQIVDVAVPISTEYLAKIIAELVSNAFKFSLAGTPVVVSLKEKETGLLLEVKDRGRGFSTEQLARIGAYMQFGRSMHEQQGLGLGLAISKRLTELHGGSLRVESDPGQGTTVLIRLPAVQSGNR